MKPYKRESQKQSARMYLRGNDHREIITADYTGVYYHNAVYICDEDKNLELAWIKYPKLAILETIESSLAWWNFKRQFRYGTSNGGGSGQRQARVYKLKDYVLYLNQYSSVDRFYISKDGIRWENHPLTTGWDFENTCQYAENGLCSEGGTLIEIRSYMDEGKEHFHTIRSQLILPPNAGNGIMGNSPNGVFYCVSTSYKVGEDTKYVNDIYNVNLTTFERVGKIENTNQPFSSGYPPRFQGKFCRKGSFFAFAIKSEFKDDDGNTMYSLITYASNDGGKTWVEETIRSDGYPIGRYALCQRAGTFYLYAYIRGELKIYSSNTGLNWYSLDVPDYTDVPIITHSGAGCGGSGYEVARIKFKSSAPNHETGTNYNINESLMEYESINEGSGNIQVIDGEPANISNEYECISFNNWNNTFRVYFDNMRLHESEGNFAFYYGGSNQIEDRVMLGDYVVGGKTDWSDNIDYSGKGE